MQKNVTHIDYFFVHPFKIEPSFFDFFGFATLPYSLIYILEKSNILAEH